MNIPISFELAKLLNDKGLPGLKTFYDNKKHYKLNPKKYTIADVVMWLYEKHGIWVECYIDDDGTFGYLVSMITKEGRIDYPLKREFKSPTEAYEAAIECILQKLT